MPMTTLIMTSIRPTPRWTRKPLSTWCHGFFPIWRSSSADGGRFAGHLPVDRNDDGRLCGDSPGCARSTAGRWHRWPRAAAPPPCPATRKLCAAGTELRIHLRSGHRPHVGDHRACEVCGLGAIAGIVGDADRAAEKAYEPEDAEREDQDGDQSLRASSCPSDVGLFTRTIGGSSFQQALGSGGTSAASAGSGSHILSPRGRPAAGGFGSSTMMRSGRASPATMEVISIC